MNLFFLTFWQRQILKKKKADGLQSYCLNVNLTVVYCITSTGRYLQVLDSPEHLVYDRAAEKLSWVLVLNETSLILQNDMIMTGERTIKPMHIIVLF